MDNQDTTPQSEDQNQTPQSPQESLQGSQSDTDNLSFKNRIDLSELQEGVALIKNEVSKVIVGQKGMIDMLIASLLANGHALIEGVPGVAKTISAKLLAKALKIDKQVFIINWNYFLQHNVKI